MDCVHLMWIPVSAVAHQSLKNMVLAVLWLILRFTSYWRLMGSNNERSPTYGIIYRTLHKEQILDIYIHNIWHFIRPLENQKISLHCFCFQNHSENVSSKPVVPLTVTVPLLLTQPAPLQSTPCTLHVHTTPCNIHVYKSPWICKLLIS